MEEFRRRAAKMVKKEREKAGLSKNMLSSLIGISRPTLIKIERGESVHEKNLAKVCKFFALDLKFEVSKT